MVTYTSSPTYWAPLKPRIRIYAFSDSSYSSPLYTYNAFTDVGTDTKPIALNFDSQTVNVGTFSIEIEDTNSTLDPDTYVRGNRVFIECSKDGSTWQAAFKGLVRGIDQNIYGETGKNIVLNGYSYLVRLNERVLNVIKESSLTGDDYNRNDSTMFSNNLINNLLTTDSNYVKSVDDTQLHSIFKTANITSSPIVEWIPRLDAQLVTVNDAINSILEFSNGLVMMNPLDDQLMLYTSDLITSATSIFLLTNQMNQNADDADYTMYPLETYRYDISYDYPESGSRLIGSIGGTGTCPEVVEEPPPFTGGANAMSYPVYWFAPNSTFYYMAYATRFIAEPSGDMSGLRVILQCDRNISSITSVIGKVRLSTGGGSGISTQVGSNMTLYNNGEEGSTFPNAGTSSEVFYIGLPEGETGVTGLTSGSAYWLTVFEGLSSGLSASNNMGWGEAPGGSMSAAHTSAYYGGVWQVGTGTGFNVWHAMDFAGSGGGVISEECSSSQATLDIDPVFAIADDKNMSRRIGVVERVISDIPQHIRTAQTLNEYLYNKLYYAAKPRFTFDYPSVSMPNKLPKAGDIVAHVDSMTNTGVRNGPMQTGVISSVQYSFQQAHDDVLGLRRLSLSTTGIKRGSY